jgi:hypothetical protein
VLKHLEWFNSRHRNTDLIVEGEEEEELDDTFSIYRTTNLIQHS